MSLRPWVLLLIVGFPLGTVEGSDQAPSDDQAKFAQAKLEAARQTFETIWKDKGWRDVEVPYRWSRRWLEAQQSVKREDQVLAFHQHLDRMKELEEVTRQQYRDRLVGVDAVSAV